MDAMGAIQTAEKGVGTFQKIHKWLKKKTEKRILSVIEETLDEFKAELPKIWMEQMQDWQTAMKEKHRKGFLKSDEMGIAFRVQLKNYLRHLGCSHIMLLEYHNGTENIATGIQYAKFDIKLDVAAPFSTIIKTNRYKDESILNYEVLVDDDLRNNNIRTFSIDELKEFDPYFYDLVMAAEQDTGTVIIACICYSGIPCGCLVFLFNNDINPNDIDLAQIGSCYFELERMNQDYVNKMNQ